MKVALYFFMLSGLMLPKIALASAALCENCNITIVQPDSAVPGVLIYANENTSWQSSGICSSTASQKRMYILQSEPMSDQLYSAALTAISSGAKVDIKGTGTCHSGVEVVRFIKIKK